MKSFIAHEPALLIGFVQAAIVLAVSFGLNLDEGQTAAILAFTAALLSVITRQQVTPVAKLEEEGVYFESED